MPAAVRDWFPPLDQDDGGQEHRRSDLECGIVQDQAASPAPVGVCGQLPATAEIGTMSRLEPHLPRAPASSDEASYSDFGLQGASSWFVQFPVVGFCNGGGVAGQDDSLR